MTTQNWPDPMRPGVPLFAERDGAHAFEYDNDSDLLLVYHWDSKELCWLEFPTGSRKDWDKRPDLDGLKYHGPVLTPTQIAAMLAGERERVEAEMGAYVKNIMDAHPEWNMEQLYSALKEREAIRNLGAAP